MTLLIKGEQLSKNITVSLERSLSDERDVLVFVEQQGKMQLIARIQDSDKSVYINQQPLNNILKVII